MIMIGRIRMIGTMAGVKSMGRGMGMGMGIVR